MNETDFDIEDAPDPAAIAGECRSRRAAPWGVLCFELELALRTLQATVQRALGGWLHAGQG